MKKCSSCKTEKSISEFGKVSANPDGLSYLCKNCTKEYSRAWRAKNPDKSLASTKKWRSKNPSKVKEYDKTPKAYKYMRKSRLMKKYGLTVAQYEELSKQQNHRCLICNGENSYRGKLIPLAVDHDHTTGKIRGLLCNSCNLGLG